MLLGEATIDSTGSGNIPVTIPMDAEAGLHTINVVGLTCGIQATIPFTVSAAPADDSASAASLNGDEQLSWTGVDVWTSIGVAAALLVLGSVMVLAARRSGFSRSTWRRPRPETLATATRNE